MHFEAHPCTTTALVSQNSQNNETQRYLRTCCPTASSALDSVDPLRGRQRSVPVALPYPIRPTLALHALTKCIQFDDVT